MFDGYVLVVNSRTGENELVSKSGLINLADAIIKNACDSYMKSNSEVTARGIEHFLLSSYGRVLLRTIEPEALIYKMKEVKTSGRQWRKRIYAPTWNVFKTGETRRASRS